MSRRSLVTLAVVTGALLATTIAFGDFSFSGSTANHADDQTTCWGTDNDACLQWDATDAKFQTNASTLEIEKASGDLIFEMDNNVLNSANFQIQNGAGNARADLVIDGNTHLTLKGQRVGILQTDPTTALDVTGDARVTTDLTVGGAVSLASIASIRSNATTDQWAFETADGSGNQLVVGSTAEADYCHSLQTDPMLFIHSDTAPSTGPCAATEWVGIYHDKTDAVLATGKGDLKIEPVAGALVQRMSYWAKATFTFETSTGTLFTLQDGDILIAAAIDVNTVFNGTSMDIDIGPASDTDGIYDGLSEASKDLGGTGYRCYDWDPNMGGSAECAFKSGGVLKSGGGSVKRYVASGSEAITLTVTAMGSASSGSADVYFQIARLE